MSRAVEPYSASEIDFTNHVSLKPASNKLVIRIFGGNIPKMNCAMNDLFSSNKLKDTSSTVTIGSPSYGFEDPKLISKTLSGIQDELPASISRICVFVYMHGKVNYETMTYNLVHHCNPEDFDRITLSGDDFFEQIIPFASNIKKPLDFVVISCYGGNLHLSEKWKEFPVNSRLLTFSTPDQPTNWMDLYNNKCDLSKLDPEMSIFDTAVLIAGSSKQESGTPGNFLEVTKVEYDKSIRPILNLGKMIEYFSSQSAESLETKSTAELYASFSVDVASRIAAIKGSSDDFYNILSSVLYFACSLAYFQDHKHEGPKAEASILDSADTHDVAGAVSSELTS